MAQVPRPSVHIAFHTAPREELEGFRQLITETNRFIQEGGCVPVYVRTPGGFEGLPPDGKVNRLYLEGTRVCAEVGLYRWRNFRRIERVVVSVRKGAGEDNAPVYLQRLEGYLPEEPSGVPGPHTYEGTILRLRGSKQEPRGGIGIGKCACGQRFYVFEEEVLGLLKALYLEWEEHVQRSSRKTAVPAYVLR